jgi:hypothetical protein
MGAIHYQNTKNGVAVMINIEEGRLNFKLSLSKGEYVDIKGQETTLVRKKYRDWFYEEFRNFCHQKSYN